MITRTVWRSRTRGSLLYWLSLALLLAGCARAEAPVREARPRRGAPRTEVTRVVTRYYAEQEPREIVYFKGPEVVAVENVGREGDIALSGNIPDGVVKEYYPDNTVLVEIPFRNNQREGVARYYYDDGSLRAEVTWRHNRVHGTVTEYDADGSVIRTATYRDGVLVE